MTSSVNNSNNNKPVEQYNNLKSDDDTLKQKTDNNNSKNDSIFNTGKERYEKYRKLEETNNILKRILQSYKGSDDGDKNVKL